MDVVTVYWLFEGLLHKELDTWRLGANGIISYVRQGYSSVSDNGLCILKVSGKGAFTKFKDLAFGSPRPQGSAFPIVYAVLEFYSVCQNITKEMSLSTFCPQGLLLSVVVLTESGWPCGNSNRHYGKTACRCSLLYIGVHSVFVLRNSERNLCVSQHSLGFLHIHPQ